MVETEYLFFLGSCKTFSDKGELLFITPRSFTSGNYFRAFRELFLICSNKNSLFIHAQTLSTSKGATPRALINNKAVQ